MKRADPISRILVSAVLAVCFGGWLGAASDRAKVPLGIPIQGAVVYPDGNPAAGAVVEARSCCESEMVNLVKKVRTDGKGSFSIPSFSSTCSKVCLSASKRDDLWLPTGDGAFLESPNGTTPEVTVGTAVIPEPVTIRLGMRGGEVNVAVRDIRSGVAVKAGLYVHRLPAEQFPGGMSTATGTDGTSLLLIPPGDYVVVLSSFDCHGKTFFVSEKVLPWKLRVDAGEKSLLPIDVDLAALETKSSYDNVEARKCLR